LTAIFVFFTTSHNFSPYPKNKFFLLYSTDNRQHTTDNRQHTTEIWSAKENLKPDRKPWHACLFFNIRLDVLHLFFKFHFWFSIRFLFYKDFIEARFGFIAIVLKSALPFLKELIQKELSIILKFQPSGLPINKKNYFSVHHFPSTSTLQFIDKQNRKNI
jgi:hypothetical protein